MLVDFLSAQLRSECQTAWPGCYSWGEADSCGLTGAPAASAGVLQRGGQALSAAARPSPQRPGPLRSGQAPRGAWERALLSSLQELLDCPRLLGLQGLFLHLFFFFFLVIMDVLELCKRGGWNDEHQHPPLGCGSLMTAVCSAHCPLPWVAVGKTSDLTPLPLSYTLSEHRAALFFLFSTLVWYPELPPSWLLAQPCAPSPQCCC